MREEQKLAFRFNFFFLFFFLPLFSRWVLFSFSFFLYVYMYIRAINMPNAIQIHSANVFIGLKCVCRTRGCFRWTEIDFRKFNCILVCLLFSSLSQLAINFWPTNTSIVSTTPSPTSMITHQNIHINLKKKNPYRKRNVNLICFQLLFAFN